MHTYTELRKFHADRLLQIQISVNLFRSKIGLLDREGI